MNGRLGGVVSGCIDALVTKYLCQPTLSHNYRRHRPNLIRHITTHTSHKYHATRSIRPEHFPGRRLRDEKRSRHIGI